MSINKNSKAILSNATKSKLGDETATILQDLLKEVNKIDLGDLKAPGTIEKFLRKVPIIRNIFTTIEEYTAKIDDIEKEVSKIESKIESSKLLAERDNNALQFRFENIKKQQQVLEKLIIAAKIKETEVQKQIDELSSSDHESIHYDDLVYFYHEIEKRCTDMLVWHASFKQSLKLIRKIQRANLATVSNADSILKNSMPMLRDQLADALSLYNTEQSVKAQTEVHEALDKIMQSNAERTKDVVLKVTKLNEDTTISFETIKKRQEVLYQMVEEEKKIWEEGRLKRLEIERSIAEMNKNTEMAIVGSYGGNNMLENGNYDVLETE